MTEVLDWSSIPESFFDARDLAAELDRIVAGTEAFSIEEQLLLAPHVLAAALSLRVNWSDPHPRRRWVLDGAILEVPRKLLVEVASCVSNPRMIALLHDVLWCTYGEKDSALRAIEAHSVCATDPAVARELRASPALMVNVDAAAHERDRDHRTRSFQLSHLERALELAQVFQIGPTVATLHDHARSLIDSGLDTDATVDVLQATAPRSHDVPPWWDEVAEAETLRVEQLPIPPPIGLLRRLFSIRIKRAAAAKDHALVAELYRRHVRVYWRAAEACTAPSEERSWWLREAVEIATRKAPDVLQEARARYAALDPLADVRPTVVSMPIPEDVENRLMDYARRLVQAVAELPSTAHRVIFLATTVDLFERIYSTSDEYGSTPIQNAFTHIQHGPNERIASTPEERLARSRHEHVWRHLQLELTFFAKPVADKLLELFDPSATWPPNGFELFDETARRRLMRALQLGRDDDYDSAVHVLAPLIERVIRRLAEQSSVLPLIPAPSDGGRSNAGTLGALLQAVAEAGVIPVSVAAGLLFVTTADVMPLSVREADHRPAIFGLNLRNEISHGLSSKLLGEVHFLLLLLCVGQLASLTAEDPASTPTSP